MADRFDSFQDMSAHMHQDVDFRLRYDDRGTSVIVIAPHGGTIEPGTSQIAQAIAASDLSFYAFEALKDGPHGDFHITSHRFDEPTALGLVGRATSAVAVHGRKDDGTDTVWLGGRATVMQAAIGVSLRAAGFGAEANQTLPGRHRSNICNRTLSGAGVQLELPRSLRRRLMAKQDAMTRFCDAVRHAILA